MSAPKILGVVPISAADADLAGGRLPQLAGRSLAEFTFHSVRQSRRLDRVIVSTDSEHVAGEARRLGMEVPFVRPPDLANPRAPVSRVLCHAVEWLAEHEQYTPDWVAMLMITYPFRPPGFIDHFIGTVLSEDLDSAFAAVEERQAHWTLNDANEPELVSFGTETAKAMKRPFFRELSGLMTMTARDVVVHDRLYGRRVGIIPTDDALAAISVHDRGGGELAALVAPRFAELR